MYFPLPTPLQQLGVEFEFFRPCISGRLARVRNQEGEHLDP